MVELPLVLQNCVSTDTACDLDLDAPTCLDPLPAVVEVNSAFLQQKTRITFIERETTDDE
jgi:hypothetical protein